jgi:hypothetical protein
MLAQHALLLLLLLLLLVWVLLHLCLRLLLLQHELLATGLAAGTFGQGRASLLLQAGSRAPCPAQLPLQPTAHAACSNTAHAPHKLSVLN